MKCSKCGYEIKEENLFCTNCGEKIDVNKNVKNDVIQTDKKSNKVKGKIKIRVWHILVLFIVIISIIIGTILLKQKKKINTELEFENTYQQELNNNVEQVVEEVKEQEKEKIEIGKKYICSTTGSDAYVIFNKDNTLEIQIGDEETEYYILKGTYKINKDTIDVHINYDSTYLVISIDEDEEDELDPSFKEYDTVIKILKDGELEYTNEYDQKYIFKLDSAEKENDKEKKDLLQSIYDKYPELESKDGYICTDGEQYWILDKSGKKVYFDDLESFESALVINYTSEKESDNTKEEQQTFDKNTTASNNKDGKSTNTNSTNSKKYINIPKLNGLTEQQAVNEIKKLNVPYKISYKEDLSKKEGIVLDQSYHDEIIKNYKGEIVAVHSRSILYEGETLYIFVNKYKERTMTINLHRTCLIGAYISRKRGKEMGIYEKIDEPLKLVVKINGEVYLSDKLTNKDLEVERYNCTSNNIKYTGKKSPKMEILINNEIFQTFTEKEMSDRFYDDDYNESGQTWYFGFTEHGAG